jgi:AcrR family transcriptional regulator
VEKSVGKVDENKQLKMNAMLDTAFRLFTDKGIAKTSISDIAASSGVAKGTFYLYFKDKYDIRNKLVAYQSGKVLRAAYQAMLEAKPETLEDKIVFFVEHVLDDLAGKPELLGLISKNLSWGILKKEVAKSELDQDVDLMSLFHEITQECALTRKDTEIMLYMIVELVGSSCYSAILYEEPCDLASLKPYLFEAVRQIVRQFTSRETAALPKER